MTYIISGISIALFFINMLFIGVYNLYMFQLNVYLNNEQAAWLRSHEKRQRVLKLDYYVSLLSMFFVLFFMRYLLIPVQLLTIWYYGKMIRKPHKNAVVWTSRVKRLLIADTIITALSSGIVVCSVIWTETHTGMLFLVYAVMSLFYAVAPYLIMVTNTINHPIEIGINNHYINDAKRILRSVPEMKIIGITGSYGKTSVKYYLDTLLKVKYNVLKTPGSFNTPMGVVKTIRGEMRPDTEIFLCEMGARYVKEIKEICDIVHPGDGIITSIGPQHLETFGSMDNIIRTKFELADAVAEKNDQGDKSNGRIFLNLDCDHIADNDDKYVDKIYYSAIDRSNDTDLDSPCYYAKNVSAEPTGTRFTVVAPDESEQEYEMKLIGIHNVINVVGAIAIANSYDISLADLVTAVRRLRPAPHRLQMLPRGNVTIIDDAYNSNPVGSKAAVETLGMFDGIRILVTPGMVELGEKEDDYNEAFGGYAASNCDYVALVGEVHTRPIQEGLIKAGFPEKKIFVGETLQEAMNFANTAQGAGHRYILLENDLSDNYL